VYFENAAKRRGFEVRVAAREHEIAADAASREPRSHQVVRVKMERIEDETHVRFEAEARGHVTLDVLRAEANHHGQVEIS
jgi:arylamine N-acetyltransferase